MIKTENGKVSIVCQRKNCKFYDATMRTNCTALSSVYNNDKKCPFFKPEWETDTHRNCSSGRLFTA